MHDPEVLAHRITMSIPMYLRPVFCAASPQPRVPRPDVEDASAECCARFRGGVLNALVA